MCENIFSVWGKTCLSYFDDVICHIHRQLRPEIPDFDKLIRGLEDQLLAMTLDSHKKLAQKYLDKGMVYLVLGDAKTQLKGLEELGLGKPIVLDTDGKRVGDK